MRFEFDIAPVEQARPRATRTGKVIRLYDPIKVAIFKRQLGMMAKQQMLDLGLDPYDGPLEEREEEKKYVVKVWDTWAISIILVKDRSGLFDILETTSVDIINDRAGEPIYQVAFTKKEINLLKDTATLNIDWDKAVEEYDGEI